MYTRSIAEFGAVGDGVTRCTAAIQATIDDVAKRGGTVVIDDGAFVTGTIFLRSNITLDIRPTGRLLAGLEPEDYPDFEMRSFPKKLAPRKTARCLICAENCENVRITGGGVIDCRGEHFCEPVPWDRFWGRKTDKLPARMLLFYGCKDVVLENFSILEMAGGWAAWINNCDRVQMRGLKVLCNPLYPNSDGIHINCSADVTLTDSILHCGDDAIILRANTNTLKEKRPCERVAVSNCTLSSASCAVRVGWTNDYIIQECVFSNLTVTDSWYGIAIEFPKKPEERFSDQGYDCTVVRRLNFSNITMRNLETAPVRILAYPYNDVKSISDIRFSGILSTSKELPIFRVEKGVKVSDIQLSDCTFETTGECADMRFRNINGIRLNNVTIRNEQDE